jgi:hydroxymethylglutaryl-CoA reductase
VYTLPLGVGLNFRVNGKDVLVPMAVEEPSVIAAASNAARLIREGGGFIADSDQPIMTTQIELVGVPDLQAAGARILAHADELLAAADAALPRLRARGGGARGLEVREPALVSGFGPRLVVHVHVDVRDAMGANLVNTVAEAIAPRLAELAEGRYGLRILTNLSDRRKVRVVGRVPFAALAPGEASDTAVAVGARVASDIEAASVFAEADPYRAATHNKGIMNGVDAVVIATGNDWRGVEAGAHAFAARSGQYRPLATWRREADALVGRLELPMAVGTAGGTLQMHAGARLALRLLGEVSAQSLAQVIACVGLASNLAALRALATEGIQRGHMRLHDRAVGRPHDGAAAPGPLPPSEVTS